MSAGLFFARLYYPDLLHLTMPSAFLLTAGGRRTIIRLVRHHRFLQVIDLTNSMIPEHENSFDFMPEHQVALNSQNRRVLRMGLGTPEQIEEYQKSEAINPKIGHRATFNTIDDGRYSVFETRFATELIVSYEIKNAKSPNQDEKEFFQEVLDEFITIYRHSSGDCRPRKIKDCREPMTVYTQIIEYDKKDKKITINQRLHKGRQLSFQNNTVKVNYDNQPFSLPLSAEENMRNMQTFLEKGASPLPWQGFLAEAKHAAFQIKNFKYAILEAFISAETMISSFLNQKKIEAGVSKSKLKDYETEVGISYIINVELPMALGNGINSSDREILGHVDKVRKNRNDIVHKGKIPSEQEAKYAVESVEKLAALLKKFE